MSKILKHCINSYGLWIPIFLIYLIPILVVSGAVDMYMKIEGIPGESADEKHKEWIIIESVSSSIARPVTGTGAGRVSGPVEHGEIVVRKHIDKATPILAREVCAGTFHPKVEIDMFKSNGTSTGQTYTLTMSECIVSAVGPGGGSGGSSGDIPTESISFNYAKIEWSYKETVTDAIGTTTNYVIDATCDEGSGAP